MFVISPFVLDSAILLSRLDLVSVECNTVKEVLRRFRQREEQYFGCGQISVEKYSINCSDIVLSIVSRCLHLNKLHFMEIARLSFYR